MMTLPLSVLANMRPPSYRVEIPFGQEARYQYAAPVFLSLAVVFFGWWVARSRAFRRGSDRALLLAGAGALVLCYSAWWVWEHRAGEHMEEGLAAIVAAEMPWLWAQFCMLLFLIVRIYRHEFLRSDAANRVLDPWTKPWRNDVLAVLLMLATGLPAVIVGYHVALVPLTFECWVLAFVAWGVMGLMARLAGLPRRAAREVPVSDPKTCDSTGGRGAPA